MKLLEDYEAGRGLLTLWLLGLALTLVGSRFLLDPLGQRLSDRGAAGWPETPGVVESWHIERDSGGFIPYPSYLFVVDGELWRGTQTSLMGYRTYSSAASAEKALLAFRIGAPVMVHYDPDDPSDAVLDISTRDKGSNGFLFGLLCAVAGCALVWKTMLLPRPVVVTLLLMSAGLGLYFAVRSTGRSHDAEPIEGDPGKVQSMHEQVRRERELWASLKEGERLPVREADLPQNARASDGEGDSLRLSYSPGPGREKDGVLEYHWRANGVFVTKAVPPFRDPVLIE